VSGRTPPVIAPADDPRATGGIRRAKSWCGLAGFAIAGLSAWMHGDVLLDAGQRALVGGVAGYLVGWAVALAVWRRILRAETQRVVELMRERAETAKKTEAAES
jgi:hypothetical protein